MQSSIEVGKILAGAVVGIVERRAMLARALAIPFALYLVVDLADTTAMGPVWAAFYFALAIALNTVFAVTTHRLVLLGSGAVPAWGLRRWSQRESRFALFMIGVALCLMPAGLLLIVPAVGPLLMVATAVWLASRLSLVFPAIAVDEPMGLADAWQLSADHQLPLVVIVGVFPLGLTLVVLGLSATIPQEGWAAPLGTVVFSIAGTLANVLTIAALSLAYSEVQRLTDRPDSSTG